MTETTLYVECNQCNSENYITVTNDALAAYKSGQLVQHVWPDFSAAQRETIIGARSGFHLCTPCWDKTFEGQNEDDNE